MRTTIVLLLICQFSYSQTQWNDTVANTSIKGLHEWEKLISETTLRGKYDIFMKNSFVTHFKIETVEELEINYMKHKKSDTNKCFLLKYDTNGLLIEESSMFRSNHYCFLTNYKYDTNGNCVGKETQYCAIIDRVITDLVLLPNIEKVYYKNSIIQRKELFITPNSKPYYVYNYFYSNRNLLEKIEIKSIKTILFKYTFY